MPIIQCESCGKDVEIPAHRTTQRYCSAEACQRKRNRLWHTRMRSAARNEPALPSPDTVEVAVDRTTHAAEYVRMSTELQRYSVDNQQARIRIHAALRGLEVVKTYADEGKSGLHLHGRSALQSLLTDVISGSAEYTVVLVYDVSRWGRFQDADESAHYEFVCRQAGIRVEYCAEPFVNDGSAMSSIVKSIKRVMAGEYSRELSEKVCAAQARIVSLGFKVGGRAGFGLRRYLVDDKGAVRGELPFGQQKNFQSDRVVLALGPDEEVEMVRQIYRWFTEERLLYAAITRRLISMGIPPPPGSGWTKDVVRGILTNEKYVGTYVTHRTSNRLSTGKIRNPPERWVKKEGAFPGTVGKPVFQAARDRIAEWPNRYSDDDMTIRLRRLYEKHGRLTHDLVNTSVDMPHSATYTYRFGSLKKACEAAGINPRRDRALCGIAIYARRSELVQFTTSVIHELRACGTLVKQTSEKALIAGRDAIVTFASINRRAGTGKWRFKIPPNVDLIVAIRTDRGDPEPEIFLFRPAELPSAQTCRTDIDGEIDAYRIGFAEAIYSIQHWRSLGANLYTGQPSMDTSLQSLHLHPDTLSKTCNPGEELVSDVVVHSRVVRDVAV
ncbi:MAG: serine recombinase [Herminiimonas sp.]|nr:serine recombinase [Herminiimonas sp.]